MTPIFSITAPVFLLIGLGYFCARKHFFPREAQKIFAIYVFYCCMPNYLFLAMRKVPRDILTNTDFLGSFALSMFAVAALTLLITKTLYRRSFTDTVLAMMGSCHTNTALIAIPIVTMSYGNPAPAVLVALLQTVVVTTIILTSIEIHQKHKGLSWVALREFPRTVLLNPIVLSAMSGIVFNLYEWPIPLALERAGNMIGSAAIPTGLVMLGLALGEARPQSSAKDRGFVYLLVGLKVFVHPALAWLAGRYLFGLSDSWLATATLVAAMPTALNNFIFAHRYETFIAESSQIVFLSSVLSLFTISGLLMLFGIGG